MCRYMNVLLCTILVSGSLCATSIVVNGTDLKEVVKSPDQALVCDVPGKNNICFSMKQGVIKMGAADLQGVDSIKRQRHNLEIRKPSLTRLSTGTVFSSTSGKSITLPNVYISAGDAVELRAGIQIELENVIIQSPEVLLECSKLQAWMCFIDADTVYIESSSPTSLIKSIRISFDKNATVPCCIQGTFDFESNETEGLFYAVGAQKVSILFSPAVFK